MSDQHGTLDLLLNCLTGKVRAPEDWPRLLNLAGETLTIGTLADAVLESRAVGEIPFPVRDLLTDIRDRARRRNALLRDQLAEALVALNGAGVTPIMMKGMARLLSSHDEEARLLSDIDLLVPAGSEGECVEALSGKSYAIVEDGGAQSPLVFGRPSDVGQIDLHSNVPPHFLRLDFGRLEPLCRPIALNGARALVPSPTAQLLLLIVHDQLHDSDYWRGLIDVRHLIDMARLADEGVDWAELASFFPPGVARNALEVQLRTARAMVGLAVPDELCGGRWAGLQLARRRLQARRSWMLAPLTLLTILAEPPGRSRDQSPGPLWRVAAWRAIHYLRSPNTGKLQLS